MSNTNFKLFTNVDISGITTSKVVAEQTSLDDYGSMEIQVDGTDLTGTPDAQVKIYQRVEHTMEYTCLETDETLSNAMIKTLSSTSGTHTFLLWAFHATDIQVEIIKNNCTGGLVNGGIGIRKRS